MSNHQHQCATNYFAHSKCDCGAAQDSATQKLLEDIAKYGANMMWHLKPDTEAGKLYARIEKATGATP